MKSPFISSSAAFDPTYPAIPGLEICILAGGRSSRMGREKSRIRLADGEIMLRKIKRTARSLDCPVRVLRKDRHSGLGPLGGVSTRLLRTRAAAVLFLACDMPLLTPEALRWFLKKSAGSPATFSRSRNGVGFPFILSQACLETVQGEIAGRRLSLGNLSKALKARVVRVPRKYEDRWLNLNTPADVAKANRFSLFARKNAGPKAGQHSQSQRKKPG